MLHDPSSPSLDISEKICPGNLPGDVAEFIGVFADHFGHLMLPIPGRLETGLVEKHVDSTPTIRYLAAYYGSEYD